MRVGCKKIFVTLFFIFIFLNPGRAFSATTVTPYLVTDEKEIVGTPNLTTTYYFKTVTINYKSGKVLLSLNSDGTGDAEVEEEIVIDSSPLGQSFSYKAGCSRPKMPPLDVTFLMWPNTPYVNSTSLTIKYKKGSCTKGKYYSGIFKEYAQVGKLYVVHFDNYETTETSFLEIPWDYSSRGMDFTEAALSFEFAFDHSYPLKNFTSLKETGSYLNQVTTFENDIVAPSPSSALDGYIWSRKSKLKYGDGVLASASGTASFTQDANCGNMISINHNNGYETRYCNLQNEGLAVSSPNQTKAVTLGQQIGKVGHDLSPSADEIQNPQLYFMVVKDKNNDGKFDDNIPDGIVDPFGWQSFDPDPWQNFTFLQNGVQKSGMRSTYLWKTNINQIRRPVAPTLATQFTLKRFYIEVPKNTMTIDRIFDGTIKNPVRDGTKESIGTILQARMLDGFGGLISQFNQLIKITIDYSQYDLSRYDSNLLSIYSRSSATSGWIKEATTFDQTTKKATINTNHFTDFGLFGEKLDSVSPVTSANIYGNLDKSGVYTSIVAVALTATDEPVGKSLGIDHISYKINSGNWQTYLYPLSFLTEGNYTITYFSQDKDGNTEKTKSLNFTINFTPPVPTPSTTPTFTPTPTNYPHTTFRSTPTPIPPEEATIFIAKIKSILSTQATSITPTSTPKPSQASVLGEFTDQVIRKPLMKIKSTFPLKKLSIALISITGVLFGAYLLKKSQDYYL